MDLQSNNQPWKVKGVSKNTRLMARVGLYLLSFTTLFWFVFSVYLTIAPSPKTGNFWNDIFPYICNTVIIGGLILINIKLIRLSLAPISFTPSYPPVKSSDPGKPFDVLYEQSLGHGRAISFIKTITFQPQGLEIPFFAPLKGSTLIVVPYAQIMEMTVKGRHVAFRISDDAYVQIIVDSANNELVTFAGTKSSSLNKALRSAYKPRVSFYVSEMDGERMYRELKKYFPSAVAQYII